MKIMIVEDDLVIAGAIRSELLKWSYEVYLCTNFDAVLEEFKQEKPELVLLDINLPRVNGYYICSQIRSISNVPIIFLSALSEKSDILSAIQMGGDDYLTKPVDLGICVAKIKALLRRTYEMGSDFDSLVYNEMTLNISKSALYCKDREIELTFTELQIMSELMKHPETYLSKHRLIEKCWKNEQFIDDNTLAVNLTRLRKKLSRVGMDPWIETRKNVGYRLVKKEGE
ncbi:MAG: response regulator transcription factor [Bacillota bacterium]|nr:response regulator transcription factor [Bacillota bacterium]